MKFKRLLFSLICAASVWCVSAADDYLHIRVNDQWQVINLNKVSRLTFTGNKMQALDASGTVVTEVPQESLYTMHVSDTPETVGITSAVTDKAQAPFTIDAATATLTFTADAPLQVVSVDGRVLVEIPAVKQGETVSLQRMGAATVILKSGSYAVKTVIK